MMSAEKRPQPSPRPASTGDWAKKSGPVGLVKGDQESLRPSSEPFRPKVLLATPQLQVRAIGTTVLEQAGFSVLVETDGTRLLEQLDTLRPDLILADEQLDNMHAAELCARVRGHSAGQTVPILVISDLCQTPALQGILAEEFTDFISAPLNWKAVTFRIHRWVQVARKFRALSDQELDLEQVRDSALKASTELLQLRNYDPVTGLPNREMFLSAVELVLSRYQRASGYLAVLHLDIDDFKGVNDVLGRALGDELLRIVAKRLQGCLREGDMVSQAGEAGSMTSFARLNGDQFAILLGSVADRAGVAAVADRLLESLARPLQIQDRHINLSARVGIADASHHDEVAEEVLVQRAEIAMRYCKQQGGKTSAFFESFMDELVQKRLQVKVELRRALEKSELFLCYQLLVDSQTAIPTGVEGLVRWQHPTRGLVPPNEFLPVAEESELIVEVDRWVLQEGCRQGKKWLDDGYPELKISLNVSMRFLEQDDFARQVLQIVEQSGLPPAALQLELSERGTLPDPGRIMAQFEMLVSAGVHLALDDFGTGQTSLSYLRTLPISCVKIDQSFVRRIPEDSASEAIVTAIAAMSHHLGLKVVAEGVETEEQWRFLAEKECNQLQGYLFSKPETVISLESSLLRHQDSAYFPAAHPWALQEQPSPASSETPGDSADATPPSEATATRSARIQPVQKVELRPASRQSATAASSQPLTDGDTAPKTAGQSTDSGTALAPTEPVPAKPTQSTPDPPSDPAGHRNDSDGYLLQLARKDFLTKLYNRFSFDERLEHALAHADRFKHKVALLLIDLDDFKYVNDTHGHAVGDGLLVALADRLNRLVRKVDTLARLGGDEFAVILSEYHDLKAVTEFARRLLAVLSQPVEVEGRELRVTGSLGVTVYPSGDTQAKDLLRQADLALYKAKSHGGNSARFFAREMDREVQRRLALARDLSGAVERGELFLEYQLQVALDSGKVLGVEALLRWDHPSRGLIGPERFIPVAESTGEIRSIGRWVISSACALAKKWRDASGRGLPVSVNLSPVQCRDRGFVDMVLAELKQHDLPPELLNLELNEKLLTQLPRNFEDSLRRLGELGVSLTLDNFGSGSSPLVYFQRFKFDRLKIHQSLVRKIGGQSVSASVLSGIVAMARKMGVQIIAEGVEKSEQRERLLAEGCEVGQGFLFGRPMSEDSLTELMMSGSIEASSGGVRSSPVESESPDGHDTAAEDSLSELSSLESSREATDDSHEAPAPKELLPAIPPELALDEPSSPAFPTPVEPSDESKELAAVAALSAEVPAEAPGTRQPIARLSSTPRSDAVEDSVSRGLDRYAAAAATPSRRAGQWRIHGVLAVAALVIWGFNLWPEAAISPRLPEVEAPITTPETATDVELQQAAPIADPRAESIRPESSLPPTAAPTASSEQLVQVARAWARAWSDQRVDAYLELYARDFDPPGQLSRDEWAAQRRVRISQPSRIEVQLSAIETEWIHGEKARVNFDQSYTSDNYSDKVRKTLELILEDGTWKIRAERAAG